MNCFFILHSAFCLCFYRFLRFLLTGRTKATISGQITQLKDRGWVDVETDASDRRVSRVVLTAEGRAAMDRLEAKLLRCLEALIGDADKTAILAALSDLYLALGATRESRLADALAAS